MKKQRVGRILTAVAFVGIIMSIIVAVFIGLYGKHYFKLSTVINGVDCSFLSVESATNKLEKTMKNAEIKFKFAEGKEYKCLGTYFNFKVTDENLLADALMNQNTAEEEQINFNVDNLYSVDEQKVKEYLSSLSIFKQGNMVKPENASLEYDEKSKSMVIKPEKYGNEINLDTACDFMLDALKKGETVIDFTKITNVNPAILSTDQKLKEEQQAINAVLSSTIEYTLYDGSTYTLDASVMKDWIVRGEDGYYSIDLDGNIPKFIDGLNEKAQYLLTSTDFNATGLGKIKIAFGRKKYATINEEEETNRIKQQLSAPGTYKVEPIYNALPNYYNINTYVELDITRQRVWMYVNGKCILDTPCVTGNVAGGYSTPVGIYYLTYKTTDTYLEGYNGDGSKYKSHVNFWMPFNGGIGFHDAAWRGSFGGKIYMTNGSHGCVNMPYNAAQTLYQNIDTSIPIILYAS